MTASTPLGLPYPEVTDRVADGWDAIRDLAVATDTLLSAAAAARAALDARLDELEDDTGWIAPALGAGWSLFAAGYAVPSYRRVGGATRGEVELRGYLKRTAGGAASPFTLPAGYRPADGQRVFVGQANIYGQSVQFLGSDPNASMYERWFAVPAIGARIDISTTGVITPVGLVAHPNSAASTHDPTQAIPQLALDGIRFRLG